MTTPSKRALAGAKAQHNGDQSEEAMKAFHLLARASDVAVLHKQFPPARLIGGKLVYLQKSTVDFVGMMLDGSGRYIAEEVKSFEGARFSLSKVLHHQRAHLDSTLLSGGLALLVVLDPLRRVHLLPWEEARGLGGVGHDDLEGWRVTPKSYLQTLQDMSARIDDIRSEKESHA